MKKIFLALIVVLISCKTEKSIKADYVIKNVHILPIYKDTILKNKTIAISNDSIVFIGEDHNVFSKNAQVIDGNNKYVLPGLSDMHVHFPKENIERNLLMYLLNGVTNLRSMEGDFKHLDLKEKIKTDSILAPKILYASPRIVTSDSLGKQKIDSLVSLYENSGFDFVKVVHVANNKDFIHLLNAGKKYGITLNGHAPRNVDFNHVVNATNYTSVEHLGGYEATFENTEKFDSLVAKTLKNNIYSTATLDFYNNFSRPLSELSKQNGLEYLPNEKKQWIEAQEKFESSKEENELLQAREKAKQMILQKQKVTKALFDKGVLLLIGPDASGAFGIPGFSVLNEMKLHAEAGISNYEVLKIATYNNAKYLNRLNEQGTVEVGKKADLILADGNPQENLEYLKNISYVFVNGKPFAKTEILSKLEEFK